MTAPAFLLSRLGPAVAALIPAAFWLCVSPAVAQVAAPGVAPDPAPNPFAKIEVDRATRTFSVPGRVIRREQPLEYLAVKRGGYKAYEAVLELDTTATDFNLACILIGLDAARATLPEGHFDPRPTEGDRVELTLEWGEGDSHRELAPEALFRVGGKPVADNVWVYTGSTLLAPGRYLAEEVGTLVGFSHDKDSIIEHRSGIGLGAFGSVEIDRTLSPTEGTPVQLRVRNPNPAPAMP
jgi:hypothetical protein